jgi:hypothetical protein
MKGRLSSEKVTPVGGVLTYRVPVNRWDSRRKSKKRLTEDLQMDDMGLDKTYEESSLNELILTRNILLAHLFTGELAPCEVLQFAKRYSTVTHWEELLCAVFNPNVSQLTAVVSIRQADGYSGILRRHGSIEYVRFFIDWGDGNGMQATGLGHFKVCDASDEGGTRQIPTCHLVSCGFEAGRYRHLTRLGIQPKVRAVLSWNYIPDLDVDFTPVFGNHVDSQISIDSSIELTSLFTVAEELSEKAMLHLGYRQPYMYDAVPQ